jgi:hypothetical protein
VAAQERVLRFPQIRGCAHERDGRFGQQRPFATELFRAPRDFLVNRPLDTLALDLEVAFPEGALDRLRKDVELYGLHEEIHRAVRQHLRRGGRIVHCREHEHRDARAELDGARNDFSTGHPRHAHVAEHRVEWLAGERVEARGPALRDRHIVAARLEELRHHRANGQIVVDHEHTARRGIVA